MKKLAWAIAFIATTLNAQNFEVDDPRWRPQDTIGKFDRMSEMIYGNMDSNCLEDLDADVSAITDVDSDSAADQDTLAVTATTGFTVGDFVAINKTGAREESCRISSISAGASLTFDQCCIYSTSSPFYECQATLNYAHTAAQGDDVELQNKVGPLTSYRMYEITVSDSSVSGVASYVQTGSTAVSADPNSSLANPASPFVLYSGEKRFMRASGEGTYISVIPQGDGSRVSVCPLGY